MFCLSETWQKPADSIQLNLLSLPGYGSSAKPKAVRWGVFYWSELYLCQWFCLWYRIINELNALSIPSSPHPPLRNYLSPTGTLGPLTTPSLLPPYRHHLCLTHRMSSLYLVTWSTNIMKLSRLLDDVPPVTACPKTPEQCQAFLDLNKIDLINYSFQPSAESLSSYSPPLGSKFTHFTSVDSLTIINIIT